MTDSFLDNAGGFTPVPDKLVREYGFEIAYVWGKVWRYCQMQSGACTASHETIAKRAGMSRRTLIEKLNILIQDGYIEDLTPNLKNKPHTYCTEKGEAKIISTMQISHTESDMLMETPNPDASESQLGMRNLHSDNADNAQSDNPTMQNLHSESAKDAQPTESTMQNLHSKKEDVVHDKELPTFETLYSRWLDNNLGELGPRQVEMFGDYYDEHPDWVSEIIDKTIGGKPANSWQYFIKIINSWVKKGKPPDEPESNTKPPPSSHSPPPRNGTRPPIDTGRFEQLKQEQEALKGVT